MARATPRDPSRVGMMQGTSLNARDTQAGILNWEQRS